MTPRLPDRYGRTEIVLMVVHPLLLYAYWEATPESCQHAQEVLGAEMDGAHAIMRIYDISLIHFDGTNAHHVFDIDVGLEAPGWYVHLWSPEKSYVADVGFLARTGRFHAVARSNVVHTPRATPSPRTDEQWMRVRFTRRTREYVPAPQPQPEEGRLRTEEALVMVPSSAGHFSAPSSRGAW